MPIFAQTLLNYINLPFFSGKFGICFLLRIGNTVVHHHLHHLWVVIKCSRQALRGCKGHHRVAAGPVQSHVWPSRGGGGQEAVGWKGGHEWWYTQRNSGSRVRLTSITTVVCVGDPVGLLAVCGGTITAGEWGSTAGVGAAALAAAIIDKEMWVCASVGISWEETGGINLA